MDCTETLDVTSPATGLQARSLKQVLFRGVPIRASSAEDTSANVRACSLSMRVLSACVSEKVQTGQVYSSRGLTYPQYRLEMTFSGRRYDKSQQTNSSPKGMYL